MTTLFTTTLNVQADSDGATQASERAEICKLLHRIIQKLGSGQVNSEANVYDDNGHSVGSWTYTPVATV
jgi:hypothetical protein